MQNLAGNPECDKFIEDELYLAGIPSVRGPRVTREVGASITGQLGPFSFSRAWRYWVVTGPVPLRVARVIYEDRIGRTDIRAGGHSGCLAPETQAHYFWTTQEVVVDPDGIREAAWISFQEVHGASPRFKFVRSEAERDALNPEAWVDTYHIDTLVGLKRFVEILTTEGVV